MNAQILRSSQRRDILKTLNDQFGLEELPYLLLETGKEKIRAFSGLLTKEQILDLAKITKVELVGLYLLKLETPVRFSFDATHILKDQCKKSVLELDEHQALLWMQGHNLQIKTENTIFIIKHKNDALGCGKSTGESIINYVPKERRLKQSAQKY